MGQNTIIVIGGSGELGFEVVKACLRNNINVSATYYSRIPKNQDEIPNGISWTQLDGSDYARLDNFFNEECTKNDVSAIIHCAVPKHKGAASGADDSLKKGIVDDVVYLATLAKSKNITFVAISTDQVFDGKLDPAKQYQENDATSAYLPYGIYKCQMEEELKKLFDDRSRIYICRTSLILTLLPQPGKSIQFVLKALQSPINESEEKLILFTDELRNMSFSCDLAEALVELASVGKEKNLKSQVFHLASPEITQRYNLAKLLCHYYKMGNIKDLPVAPGKSADTNLNRPLNLSMNTDCLQSNISYKIRGITEYFDSLKQ